MLFCCCFQGKRGGGQQLFIPAMDFGVKPALLSSFLRPEAPLCSFLWGGAVWGHFGGVFGGLRPPLPLLSHAALPNGGDGMEWGGGVQKMPQKPQNLSCFFFFPRRSEESPAGTLGSPSKPTNNQERFGPLGGDFWGPFAPFLPRFAES